MLRKQLLMGAAIATAAGVMAGSAAAACKQGFCVSGHDRPDNKSWHFVDFTTSLRNYTHFNVWQGAIQIELGKNQRSFHVLPENNAYPLRYVYKIQACNKGGAFSRSSCTPWVTFTHTRLKP
jgi:hypothetical protein